MKKRYLLLVSALCLTFQAFGQSGKFFIGGDVGFSTTSYSNKGTGYPKSQYDFSLQPSIGYYLSDKLAIGTGLGFSVYGNTYNTNPQVTDATTNFSITPFVRYALIEVNNFSFIGQGSLGVGFGGSGSSTGGTTTTGPSTFNFNFGISPGFQYKLNDKISLETFFGDIGLKYNSTTPKTGSKTSNTNFNFSLGSGLSLGFIYFLN